MADINSTSPSIEPTVHRPSLLRVIQSTPATQLASAVRNNLATLSPIEQYDELNSLFNTAEHTHELVLEGVNAAWNHMVEYQVWRAKYLTRQDFQQDIAFHQVLEPILIERQRFADRRDGTFRTLKRIWGKDYNNLFPPSIHPGNISVNLARHLGQLSALTDWDNAMNLIEDQIYHRKNPLQGKRQAGTRATDKVTVIDISKALENLKANLTGRAPSQTIEGIIQTPSIYTDFRFSTRFSIRFPYFSLAFSFSVTSTLRRSPGYDARSPSPSFQSSRIIRCSYYSSSYDRPFYISYPVSSSSCYYGPTSCPRKN